MLAAAILIGCGKNAFSENTGKSGTDYDSDNIKIWVADAIADLTKTRVDSFLEEHPDFSDYTVTVEAIGEDYTRDNMIADISAGADLYAFSQDSITNLVDAGALAEVAPENTAAVRKNNDSNSIAAATVGDRLYAYPLTSDNGFFLYYDKSIITDPSDLDQILADCEAAGKNFYMEIINGWYQSAFFFATGCTLSYGTDTSGSFTGCIVDYATDHGIVAMREMIRLNASPAFRNGSIAGEASNIGAIVDGTWDSSVIKDLLGDNYACARLPSFTGSDGKTYQMSGFSGFKLLGIKPQEDEEKFAACSAIAAYLSGEEMQMARFEAVGWGPSNIKAQHSDAVLADDALCALRDQLPYTIPQGQYPSDYWDLTVTLGDEIMQGNLTSDSTDREIINVLQRFQDACISYAE